MLYKRRHGAKFDGRSYHYCKISQVFSSHLGQGGPSLLSLFLLIDECHVNSLEAVDHCRQSSCCLSAELAIEKKETNGEVMRASTAEQL